MTENIYRPEGTLIQTAENAEYLSSLAGLERAAANGKILEATALMCDSDMSIIVDLGGIRGIIPREEAALTGGEPIKDIAIITRVGKPVCFKIISLEYDESGKPTARLSRKAAQRECTENYILALSAGDVIPAKVTHLEHFGAFLDIGCGVVSLLAIDCISVSRISHPGDRFAPGDSIYIAVKAIDRESGRIYATHKELLGTWEENASRFAIGQTVVGIVRSVESYGIFVELAPNLAGLAEYKEGVSVGESAAVYIKNIIPERMKIKLVLIDNGKSELPEKKPDYFIGEGAHIESWRYSPDVSVKTVETVF